VACLMVDCPHCNLLDQACRPRLHLDTSGSDRSDSSIQGNCTGTPVIMVFSLAATAISMALAAYVSWLCYILFLHPLASIPGPKRALLNYKWYSLMVRDGRARDIALKLHKRYGHAVRIDVNEVWFDTENAFRIIYSTYYSATSLPLPRWHSMLTNREEPGSGFEKSDFYSKLWTIHGLRWPKN
jgi:hypothetical protein